MNIMMVKYESQVWFCNVNGLTVFGAYERTQSIECPFSFANVVAISIRLRYFCQYLYNAHSNFVLYFLLDHFCNHQQQYTTFASNTHNTKPQLNLPSALPARECQVMRECRYTTPAQFCCQIMCVSEGVT